MNIVVDNGCIQLKNVGDISMLQTTLARLRTLFPQARLHVITADAARLRLCCPEAISLPAAGRERFCRAGSCFAIEDYTTSPRTRPSAHRLETALTRSAVTRSAPALLFRFLQMRLYQNGINPFGLETFMSVMSSADLYVACGGGYLNDQYPWMVVDIMQTLELARALGVPTAMMGQGLGPIDNTFLRERVGRGLQTLSLLGLRERRIGPALATSLGVRSRRIAVTGDDAIEMANAARKSASGTGIGISPRIADKRGEDVAAVDEIRRALFAAARQYNAPLIPLPMTHDSHDDDTQAIGRLLEGCPVRVLEPSAQGKLPAGVIDDVSRCRIVVTGRYHAAVFALSQGIPVVALAKSTYYADKFLGLADAFGCGCDVLVLDEQCLQSRLRQAIDRAWAIANGVRLPLLEAAGHQVAASRSAYQKLTTVTHRRYSLSA